MDPLQEYNDLITIFGDPQVVKWPLSFQIAACACNTRKAYLESVEMTTLFPFPSSKAMSAEELMLLNCGVGEDSLESLGLQGDPTSQS